MFPLTAPCDPHLHVQHSVEYGLSETFPYVSLLVSVYDLIPELLLRHDTPTPADLIHTHARTCTYMHTTHNTHTHRRKDVLMFLCGGDFM